MIIREFGKTLLPGRNNVGVEQLVFGAAGGLKAPPVPLSINTEAQAEERTEKKLNCSIQK